MVGSVDNSNDTKLQIYNLKMIISLRVTLERGKKLPLADANKTFFFKFVHN